MSLWKRIKNVFTTTPPPVVEKSLLTLAPGDMCEVSLVTYEVTGRTANRSRNAVVLTLRDGVAMRYLVIEEREQTVYALYESIDGRLDSPDEVPTTLELDGHDFHLEEQYHGWISVVGSTPFSANGEQHVWQYQADNRRLLRIEWQNGRFMLYEGEQILPADVKIVRAS